MHAYVRTSPLPAAQSPARAACTWVAISPPLVLTGSIVTYGGFLHSPLIKIPVPAREAGEIEEPAINPLCRSIDG